MKERLIRSACFDLIPASSAKRRRRIHVFHGFMGVMAFIA
jgi:hypothetical protein